MEEINKQRRKWLALGGIALGVGLLPLDLLATLTTPKPKILSFKNLNTGEKLNSAFTVGKGVASKDLSKLNYLLRDRRTNKVAKMDTKLFAKLYNIQSKLGLRNAQLLIVSAYRAPETNNKMRKKSSQVASNSYHMRGQAIDFRIAHVPLKKLRTVAENLKNGGVGYYPVSNFVHIDTGPARTWRGS